MLEVFLVFLFAIAIAKRNIAFALLMSTVFEYGNWLFGTNTSDFIVYHNLSDTGILLDICIAYILSRRKYRNGISIKFLRNGVTLFLVFFLCTLMVDMVANTTSVVSDFKAVRKWVPLVLLLVYYDRLRPEEGVRYFRYLIVLQCCFSALFIYEWLTDTTITGAVRTLGGERASLPLPIALLLFSILLYGSYGFSKKFRWMFFIVLFANIVACASRSFFISYAVVFALFFLYQKMSLKKIALVLFAALAMGAIFNTDNVLSRRFAESASDISSLRAGSNEVNGNFSFRLLHAGERLNYVLKSWQYTVFGIGQVEEKDLKTEIFSIGLVRDGKKQQVDTGDIAWSIAFIRWGVVGTILYLVVFYFRFVRYYFRNRQYPFARAMFFYLITEVCFISFTYPEIVFPTFWIPVMIGFSCYKENSWSFTGGKPRLLFNRQ